MSIEMMILPYIMRELWRSSATVGFVEAGLHIRCIRSKTLSTDDVLKHGSRDENRS
jgi:hypothetical protein